VDHGHDGILPTKSTELGARKNLVLILVLFPMSHFIIAQQLTQQSLNFLFYKGNSVVVGRKQTVYKYEDSE
jgi:hypothetical protein